MIINKFISITLPTVVLKQHSNKLKQERKERHCNDTKTSCPFQLSQLQLHVSHTLIFFSWSKPWKCSNNNLSHLTWMWSRSSICSICSRHYMYLTKYSHFLGALLDTGLRNALIQNDGSLLFWQSPVALTRHRTYNFLTLHCQKFYSPFPKQSSLSLRVGLCCCWSYIYRHPVATFEDYGWLVHSHLKKKQLNDHYFILIHVNDKLLTKAWHMA